MLPDRNKQTANAKQNAIGPAMSVSLSKKLASSALDWPWKGLSTASVFSNILSGYISSSSSSGGSSNSDVTPDSCSPGMGAGVNKFGL